MSKKLLLAVLVLGLSLIGAANPCLAQADRDVDGDVLAKLESQGWKIMKAGVLQRELRSNEVETFVYGVEGFTWKLQDLRIQLQRLRTAFQADPTPELRKAIANHRKMIASTVKMIEQARIAEASGETGIAKNTCTLNFAYNADGGSKTDVQGIWASSSANFNASAGCGYSGEVYAMAFAQTYVNGASTTETVTDGPRSGANVSASAYASRNGGAPCETNSFASVTSYNLNPSSYTKSKQTYSCNLPLRVTVTSDWGSPVYPHNGECFYVTWTVSISGGTPGYTSNMYLNNYHVGSGTSYSDYICGAYSNMTHYVTFRADVTDSSSPQQSASGSHTTTVHSSYYQNNCYDPYSPFQREYCIDQR